jgi:hypothetical protein
MEPDVDRGDVDDGFVASTGDPTAWMIHTVDQPTMNTPRGSRAPQPRRTRRARSTKMDRTRYRNGMDTTPPSDERQPESTSVPTLPEATVAGDWTILAAVAAAITGLLIWRKRSRQGQSHL